MPKLPAFQFYPGDWLQDAVAGCSLAAQGLWLRMMFVAHNSEQRGYLGSRLVPMSSEAIARHCGVDLDTYTGLLTELEIHGVPSRTCANTLYSRRMVRDEKSRLANKFRQQDFRNKNGKVLSDIAPGLTENAHIPNKTKENSNALVTPMSQPSSSSSSNTKPKAKATPSAFVLPDWVPRDAWDGFVAMRQRIRAPLTDRAKQGILRDLDRLRTEGCAVAEVLNQSEKLAWRGVFRLRQENGDLNAARRPIAENFPRASQKPYTAEDREANMRHFWENIRDWKRRYNPDLQKQIVAWGKVNDPEGYALWLSEHERAQS